MKPTRILALMAMALMSGMAARAQESDCTHRSVAVNVVASDGQAVRGIGAGSFVASYRHKDAKIVSVAWDEAPRRVAILVDLSDSTASQTVRTLKFGAADELIAQLPASTAIGLAIFTDKTEQMIPLTTDRTALQQALSDESRVRPKERAGLGTAVADSARTFDTLRSGDVMYVISNPEDSVSRVRWGELKGTLLNVGVRVFALEVLPPWMEPKTVVAGPPTSAPPFSAGGAPVLSTEPQSGMTSKEVRAKLQDLVDSTGGSNVMLWEKLTFDKEHQAYVLHNVQGKPTELSQAVRGQVQQVVGFLKLDVQLPQRADKPVDWELRLAESTTLKDATLIYPHVLPGCHADGLASSQLR
ncbi:MAG TPA: VWA domain-containing protein [Candidatus Acidoferrales bacterium]|nr:VWA domain-containing protein [Candidatus Acidoferrales bacterium]